MTGIIWLDWIILAVSFTNTILLLWLGLTLLLNAERRTWGAWVAGSGLLLGGIFFISHSAILGLGAEVASKSINFWWYLGWILIVTLPLCWYMMMLWFVGFWDDKTSPLYLRQRPWFILMLVLAACMLGVLGFTNLIPSYSDVAIIDLNMLPTINRSPILILIFLFYIISCISLSVDALRRPGPTGRVMGNLARQRARPWLAATSVVQLIVSLLIAGVLFWIIQMSEQSRQLIDQISSIAIFDLIIESLICGAIIMLGQAIVSYEIFTGKALPRRGFLRYWRRAIILGIGYSAIVSWSVINQLRPIYSLLLTILLMTAFYALLSWRSYTERERYINHLRPFVTSQGLMDHLTHPHSSLSEVDIQVPFNALCRDVLGARVAYLVATGPLAPLVGSHISYPHDRPLEFPSLYDLSEKFQSPQPKCIQIDPGKYLGAKWAVMLWSERGQIGMLLLGEKFDGGLYTLEEIEIAQTSCERLIDNKASAEIAQRLMVLQRQRIAESQLLDQRARRVLHDEVLQKLHTAMLKLVAEQSKPNGGTSEAIELLAEVHSQISDLLREMPTTSIPEITQLGLIGALQKVVREELGVAFEEVRWEIAPKAEREAQDISPLTAEVVYFAAREAIRNAARHGRTEVVSHPLHLRISIEWDDGLSMKIEDDGVGLSYEPRRGENIGQGLALHSTMMAVVGGELAISSKKDEYTCVTLSLPGKKSSTSTPINRNNKSFT
jgi:signal transduction histidine kinase